MLISVSRKATKGAVGYIHAAQDSCGAWFGRWGICFTYATMFALESLSLVDETYENSESVRRACDFLISKQRADGGWGESWEVSKHFFPSKHTFDCSLDMREARMDRTRKLPSRPNCMGRAGPHVCKIPVPRTPGTCRSFNNAPPVTGKLQIFFSNDTSEGTDMHLPGRIMGTRSDRRSFQ